MMMVHTLKSRELLDQQGVKRRKGGKALSLKNTTLISGRLLH